MKTNKFYKEANDMQPGWGNTLKNIDRLKDKVDSNKCITINEACFVIYGESIASSSVYLRFKDYAIKMYGKKTFPWLAWKALFYNWNENVAQNKTI